MTAIRTPNATDQMMSRNEAVWQFLSSLKANWKEDKSEMNLEEFSGILNHF
jgi:hypothetical protein